MCTVSLVVSDSSEKNFILTSNRDEAPGRDTIPPAVTKPGDVRMLFPRDAVAGGTWIGVSEHCRLVCLLNGGFQNHVRKENYRMSRGVVVKDLLATPSSDEFIAEYDLDGIEPFTVILVEWKFNLRFMEFVWDGQNRHFKELPLESHLWSSVPLYTPEMKNKRTNWFDTFYRENNSSPEALWRFHHEGGVGDREIDLVMDRGFIKTQSITQIYRIKNTTFMNYEDLNTGEVKHLQVEW